MGVSDAEEMLAAGVRVAREAGFDASGVRVEAERRTSQIIADTAEEHDAPLIVMGQRERSGLGTLLLGSVARELLRSHHRPVLMVGPSGPATYPG